MEEVPVPVSLLEEWRDIFTTAMYHSQSLDLADSYRTQTANPKWSKLTTRLTACSEVTHSFIEAAHEEEDNDESSDDAE